MPTTRPARAGQAKRDRAATMLIHGRHANQSGWRTVGPFRQPNGYRDDMPASACHRPAPVTRGHAAGSSNGTSSAHWNPRPGPISSDSVARMRGRDENDEGESRDYARRRQILSRWHDRGPRRRGRGDDGVGVREPRRPAPGDDGNAIELDLGDEDTRGIQIDPTGQRSGDPRRRGDSHVLERRPPSLMSVYLGVR
jgi:hypothetical protein